jgi:diacylglycerol kinase
MAPSTSPAEDDSQRRRSPFSLRRFVRSFGYAFAGLAYLIRTQPNFRVHLLAAALVAAASAVLEVRRQEAAILALAVGLVLAAEALNTAVELLLDAIAPDHHPLVGRSKDAAAAAVLLAAMAAMVVAVFILLPYLLRLFGCMEF